jgi:hypothetical protein
MVPVIPHAAEFLRKLSVIYTGALRKVCQPCCRSKKLKEYEFEGAQNY